MHYQHLQINETQLGLIIRNMRSIILYRTILYLTHLINQVLSAGEWVQQAIQVLRCK